MKRDSVVPCGTVSPIHQNLAFQGYLLSMLHAPFHCGWAIFTFSRVICNGILCLLWAEFGPCTVKWPVSSRACSWVRPDVCPQTCTGATENCRMLLVLSPEKFLLVGRASNHISCLPPAIARVAVELMYAVISHRAKVPLKWWWSLSALLAEWDMSGAAWRDSYTVVWVGWGESTGKCRGSACVLAS